MRVMQAGIPWLARGWEDPKPKPKPERMMTYDFPLRPGLMVRCTLPLNLTTEDAERIKKFVNVLVFDDPRPVAIIKLEPKQIGWKRASS